MEGGARGCPLFSHRVRFKQWRPPTYLRCWAACRPGRKVRRPDATIAVADHNIPTTNRAAGAAGIAAIVVFLDPALFSVFGLPPTR